MIKLLIENFSCIKRANLELGDLTILIGPQASGKSVISKLIYFFIETISEQYEHATDQNSFDKYGESLKTKFTEWFPIGAWGNGKLKVEFQLGDYKLRLTRTSYDASVRDGLRLWCSPLAKSHFKEVVELSKSLRKRVQRKSTSSFSDLELDWRLRDAGAEELQKKLGRDFIESQIFIPAGRSFFTTLGRAIRAFDQGSTLDPITVRFGGLYSNFQDDMRLFARSRRFVEKPGRFETLLGGNIVWDSDRPSLISEDGRRVPFSALSSGQQELLPLAVILSSHLVRNYRRTSSGSLLYIEEPEAHLFPNAQSALVENLSALVLSDKQQRRLMITTHSPYVLAKINNLTLAGIIQQKANHETSARLSNILPPECHINPKSLKAYAIIDGTIKSIVDHSGLIDASYLDSVSGSIASEFDALLELEATQ